MPETLIAIVALVGSAGRRRRGDRGDRRRAVPAGDAGDGPGRPLRLPLPRPPRAGPELDAHRPTLERDLLFFLAFFALSLALAWGAPAALRIPIGVVVFLAYPVYIRRTLLRRRRGPVARIARPADLRAPRRSTGPTPGIALCVIQLLVGLGAMVGGAHLFVEELLNIAESLGIQAVVLSLVLAPLATELPEKVNSFFWVREGKDSLALGNITGAMVFQSTIPFGIGLLFTDWSLSGDAPLSVALGLVGGFLAYETLHRRDRFSLPVGGRLVRSLRELHRDRRANRLSGAPAACSSASASSTTSSWVFGETFGKTLRIVPSGPIMNVARSTPQVVLPYIDFSPQVP